MASLKVIRAVIQDEVTRRVGPRYQPDSASSCVRWGQQPGHVMFGGKKLVVERPRVRTRKGQEVSLESDARLQHDGHRQRAESRVSPQFVAASAAQLQQLCEKKSGDLDVMALLIDGIHLGQQVLVVALGIETRGPKQVLGLWQGTTENTTVVKERPGDLVARGLAPEKRNLFVIDGAKALRAAIERVFGARAQVQRCQIHKRRNVKDHLPKQSQGDADRRTPNAHALTQYAQAKAELEKIFRQPERVNPSVAHP
jgi:putative transposase